MLILTESRCKECKVRISEYERIEKKGYCMDCAKEAKEN